MVSAAMVESTPVPLHLHARRHKRRIKPQTSERGSLSAKGVGTPSILCTLSPPFTPSEYPTTCPALPGFSCILNPQSAVLGGAHQRGPGSNGLTSKSLKTSSKREEGPDSGLSGVSPAQPRLILTLKGGEERFELVTEKQNEAGRMRR